jgi:hypothetical protein
MIENSTLLYIMDGSEDDSEIINVYDLLDPYGKSCKELETVFTGIEYSPRQEIISNILLKA